MIAAAQSTTPIRFMLMPEAGLSGLPERRIV
jgi:hypothetical protein